MSKQKLLLQMEMFDEMSKHGLSPNQYYLLCCKKDSVTPLKINLHMELRSLKADGWINDTQDLTPKAVSLISVIEKLFSIQKKKTNTDLMGKGFSEKIKTYNEIFPKKKLRSGRAARSAPKNVEKAFRWFFETHKYSWETVYTATKIYRKEMEEQNDDWMQTSQYFIRKNDISKLADYCYAYEEGGLEEDTSINQDVKLL
jgi:hypothetical protein